MIPRFLLIVNMVLFQDNFFQAVLAVGETDAGVSQTFVLFLYEQLQTPSIVQVNEHVVL